MLGTSAEEPMSPPSMGLGPVRKAGPGPPGSAGTDSRPYCPDTSINVVPGSAGTARPLILFALTDTRRAGRTGGDGSYSLASLTEDDEITKAVEPIRTTSCTASPSERAR